MSPRALDRFFCLENFHLQRIDKRDFDEGGGGGGEAAGEVGRREEDGEERKLSNNNFLILKYYFFLLLFYPDLATFHGVGGGGGGRWDMTQKDPLPRETEMCHKLTSVDHFYPGGQQRGKKYLRMKLTKLPLHLRANSTHQLPQQRNVPSGIFRRILKVCRMRMKSDYPRPPIYTIGEQRGSRGREGKVTSLPLCFIFPPAFERCFQRGCFLNIQRNTLRNYSIFFLWRSGKTAACVVVSLSAHFHLLTCGPSSLGVPYLSRGERLG